MLKKPSTFCLCKQQLAQQVKVHVGEKLPKQESVKYLTVKIDNWKLYTAARQEYALPVFFVLPQLDYCSHMCGATLTRRVEWVQNYALRMILRKPLRTSSEVLKQKLDMLSPAWVKTTRTACMVCQVNRCLSIHALSYLADKFTTNSIFGCTNTHGFHNKIHPKCFRSEFYCSSDSVEFQGAKLHIVYSIPVNSASLDSIQHCLYHYTLEVEQEMCSTM